ncbi:MAG: aminotransferase class V-fold PLP-dependent enzyme [Oscillospiraceae bacterium]|nr:aminotransferase class V-fold PLP-dependent enzyme [Oscillospiraceae bacterium]
MPVYLDYAAATPPCRAALEAFERVSRDCWYNPASLHAGGRAASDALEAARARAALALEVLPEEIVFCSGGTEANNLALKAAAGTHGRRRRHIVSTTLEHPSVLETLKALKERGFEVTLVPPGGNGALAVESVLAACRGDTFLVSVCAVCGETGAAAPLEELRQALRERFPDALLHTDAAQGFLTRSGPPPRADLVTVSGHKIGAPKGIGILSVRRGLRLAPELHGGGQESGLRSGTANAPLAASLAAAIEAYVPPGPALRAEAAARLEAAGAEILPLGGPAAPHILCFAVRSAALGRYLPGEALTRMLSDKGVYLSAGSACKRGKRGPALDAMTLPPGMADGMARASFGGGTGLEDIDALCEAIRRL